MVRHLEPAVLEQCRHLTVDETFELTAGIEVGDDAAFGAHQMMVMVLRIRLGEFVTIAAARARHTRHHADVDEFSELPVHGGGGHTRLAHHFVGRERTVGGFDGRHHRGTVRCEAQPASRQHLADGGGDSSRTGHAATLPARRYGNDSHSWYAPHVAVTLPRSALRALSATVLVFTAAACGSNEGDTSGRPVVVAAFAPIEEILRAVGGDAVRVVTLVPPGEEAHEYEPTAQQLQGIDGARFVAYLGGGFQSGVEKAIDTLPSAVERLDLLKGLTLLKVDDGSSAFDPHVWLDPNNMIAMAEAIAARMSTVIDPSIVTTNLQAYRAQLEQLDQTFSDGLRTCTSRMLVTGHRAFAYLAAAYQLDNVAVAGISPGEEPSAATLQHVADLAATNHVTTIFFEENLPPALSQTVADEVGATTAVLDPIESLSADQIAAGDDYVSLMNANLAALRKGLGCT